MSKTTFYFSVCILFMSFVSCEEQQKSIPKRQVKISNEPIPKPANQIKSSNRISKKEIATPKKRDKPVVDPFYFDLPNNYFSFLAHRARDEVYQDSILKCGKMFEYVIGETYQYTQLAQGWKSDTTPQGLSYMNLYESDLNTVFNSSRDVKPACYYRYKDGLRINGKVSDIINYSGLKQLEFEGEFKNGLLQGHAIFYYSEKDRLDHRLDCKTVSEDIQINTKKAEGMFLNGYFVGTWTFYNCDGSIKFTKQFEGKP